HNFKRPFMKMKKTPVCWSGGQQRITRYLCCSVMLLLTACCSVSNNKPFEILPITNYWNLQHADTTPNFVLFNGKKVVSINLYFLVKGYHEDHPQDSVRILAFAKRFLREQKRRYGDYCLIFYKESCSTNEHAPDKDDPNFDSRTDQDRIFSITYTPALARARISSYDNTFFLYSKNLPDSIWMKENDSTNPK
ncbi:MAG TPA: hypothetical protein VG842_09735, partial [Sediminibacterium sp.]|nr:hypothetical protein [Sediminibacterium sp.]